MGGPEVAGSDADGATRVDRSTDVPSAATFRRTDVSASEQLRARFDRVGDGGRLGRYVLLRLLGEGGMGVVFAAYDADLDRRVAIKLLRTDDPRLDRGTLLAEAKAMARLSHPNVVQIYDVGEIDDQVFVAMELVSGASLRDWLRERPRGTREIVRAFGEAGRGLQAVHDAGLVHRDFKPQNVLVSADGRVRVLDFGLAFAQREAPTLRSVGDDPQVSMGGRSRPEGALSGGTPAFMSPEQHAGAAIDARSDQFSFCVALYEALFHQRPFAGEDGRTLAASIVAGALRPPPPDSRVPAWIRRPVLRGLAQDPAQRWPSMTALLDALERDPWRLRLRVLAGLAFVAALATALATVFHYRRLVEEQAAEQCAGGPTRLAEVWGPDLRAAADAAFRATGVAYAEDTWSKVQVHMDSFGDAWTTAHRRVCEDRRRGELSEALSDRASGCLDAARRDFGALAQVLTTADAAAVERAVKAAERLPNPARCEDREALVAAIRPPDDPAVAAEVESIRDVVAAIRADVLLSRTGRCAELPALQARAGALEYRPLRAEVAAARGACAETLGDYPAATAAMREAVVDGVAARHDVMAVEVATRLIHVLAFRQARHAEADVWLDVAGAVVDRLGGRDDLRVRVMLSRGSALIVAGKPAEALRWLDDAEALLEKIGGPPTTEMGIILNNRAAAHSRLGHTDQVAAAFERALAIYRETLGPAHPDLVLVMGNLGNIRALGGDLAGAEAIQREALALKERLLGPEHPDIAVLLTNLSMIHERRKDHAAGRAVLERALAIREKTLGPDNPSTASSLINLGDLFNELGEAEAALPLLRRALGVLEKVEGPNHPTVAAALVRLARAEMLGGADREARGHLERAAAIHAASGAASLEASFTDFYLARAQWATSRTPQERARARATAEAALAKADRVALADEVAKLEAWLAGLRAD